jgi:hypothetical protein
VHGTDNELIYEAIVAVVAAGLIYFAYCLGGFLGVGVLGLLVAYVAFQADLNRTGSYVTMGRPAQEDHRDKAARQLEAGALATQIGVGKLLGLGLAVIGFGLFFFF